MPDRPPGAIELTRLARLIASMPPLPRLIFELHRFDAEPLTQIAITLELDVGEVEGLLAAAMLHLSWDGREEP